MCRRVLVLPSNETKSFAKKSIALHRCGYAK